MNDQTTTKPGALMAREAAEAPAVFARAALQDIVTRDAKELHAIYTIARGSSDAAATILAYEFMSHLSVPVTSLPPSVFSLGKGVNLDGCMALVISQSGASDDLVKSAEGARTSGACVVAITNAEGSPVEAVSDVTARICAGPELAVPATKSVIGSIGAGMALLAALDPQYHDACAGAAATIGALANTGPHPQTRAISAALLRSQHIYVIGRGAGYGAAQEAALKLKETCVLHAEAYSASEVLHGPLQLVSNPLLVIILDSEEDRIQPSLNIAEERFRTAGSTVFRLRPSDIGAKKLVPAAAGAALLHILYPIIQETAVSLGFDPDAPANLAKVTKTL